ncbi:17816_t:CDS:2, partial [Gigaspora margarita]
MRSNDLRTEDQLNNQKNQLNKKNARKSNKQYVETQLKAYISKLKSTKQYDNVEPISIDNFSEKLKSDVEFAYMGALFSHAYKVMEVANTKKNNLTLQSTEEIRWLMAKIEKKNTQLSVLTKLVT